MRSTDSEELPLLGGLLRLVRQELVNHLETAFDEAGMGDVRPAHYAVTQALAVESEGLRLTELAAYAGISKPSMSALVDSLELNGYVERIKHPTDQRSQIVRLTKRGWSFTMVARKAVRNVERQWAARVGREDVETLRRVLRSLVATRPASSPTRRR